MLQIYTKQKALKCIYLSYPQSNPELFSHVTSDLYTRNEYVLGGAGYVQAGPPQSSAAWCPEMSPSFLSTAASHSHLQTQTRKNK